MSINPKDLVQAKARGLWNKTRKGTLAMATGTGKSKIAIDRAIQLLKEKPAATILLVVPTTRLRDSNWKDEFEKWGAGDAWSRVNRSCYVSINKFDSTHWDLVILDEAHNITLFNATFFAANNVKEILGLTATPPRDQEKIDLLNMFAPICFVYRMDEAVTEGLVAPYKITIYSVPLNRDDKYIQGGTKIKPFMSTEAANYLYLCKRIDAANFMGDTMKKITRIARMTFLKNLRSKTDAIRTLLASCPQGERMVVFCGSIEQAEEVLPGQTYHSKLKGKTKDDALNAFIAGTISKLSCVSALNEGINITNVDSGVVSSFDSNPKNITQRIGRFVRLRPGHVAQIHILVAQGTIEETWISKALVDFDQNNIVYNDIRNVQPFIVQV